MNDGDRIIRQATVDFFARQVVSIEHDDLDIIAFVRSDAAITQAVVAHAASHGGSSYADFILLRLTRSDK